MQLINNEDNERMDPARKKQCSIILKKLMNHTSVLLHKHLDLRRIERKLNCNAYPTTSRFAADVRQTLANAMQNHPSTDEVHIKAKELNNIFNVSWKTRNKWWIDIPEPRPEKKQKVAIVNKNLLLKAKEEQALQTHQFTVETKTFKTCKDGVAEEKHDAQPLDTHPCTANSATTFQPCKYVAPVSETKAKPSPDTVLSQKRKNNYLMEEQISPSKALHVAKMKARFADTIIKAQKALQFNDMQVDLKVEMQKQVKYLEKQHHGEKTRLEYQRKMQIQKEREGARIAREKMEQTAKLNQSLEKEVERSVRLQGIGRKFSQRRRETERNRGRSREED
ncbi:transcription factor GTE12-like [Dioscorea cayenensis subsp. rotundata]|uniref:Transcription factor GTE12-like n=1 Tax=Dioscorea cayennensis subsp. rotundata TaxID=55577 RepID=A0AB40D179_DIOCR|nr:transcription factor GTE12-like [Dioscorea cayenensis subsp. rotundata]